LQRHLCQSLPAATHHCLLLLLLLHPHSLPPPPPGVDIDYEPTNSNCVVGATSVSCTTDPESVSVTSALRAALPKGQYLLSTASWHVGCYGEGGFKVAQPASIYTGGLNLGTWADASSENGVAGNAYVSR
jgi:hypothetical protein